MIRLVGDTGADLKYRAAQFAAWPAMIACLVQPDQDIVVLDVLLPELMDRITGTHIGQPVLLLSALSRQRAEKMAPGPGAIATIGPALSKIDLIDSIRAAIWWNEAFSRPAPRLDCPTMNLHGRDVVVSGRMVDLTSREYAILELVVFYGGILLTRRALSEAMDKHLTKVIDVFGMAWRRAA